MENRESATQRSLELQVRELGFDPAQLTLRERRELVELYRRYPNEVLTQAAR